MRFKRLNEIMLAEKEKNMRRENTRLVVEKHLGGLEVRLLVQRRQYFLRNLLGQVHSLSDELFQANMQQC